MNVLLLGSGGREHAIAWNLAQSPKLSKLWIAPGNAGMEQLGELVDVKAMDLDGVVALAQRTHADLVIVGPEDPLSAGITDRLTDAGLRVFGPTAAAARLEGSKDFANQLMANAGIATSRSQTFDDPDAAKRYVRDCDYQVVIKADGLAGGKGVTVCDDTTDAEPPSTALWSTARLAMLVYASLLRSACTVPRSPRMLSRTASPSATCPSPVITSLFSTVISDLILVAWVPTRPQSGSMTPSLNRFAPTSRSAPCVRWPTPVAPTQV
jgi:hypothetical protein